MVRPAPPRRGPSWRSRKETRPSGSVKPVDHREGLERPWTDLACKRKRDPVQTALPTVRTPHHDLAPVLSDLYEVLIDSQGVPDNGRFISQVRFRLKLFQALSKLGRKINRHPDLGAVPLDVLVFSAVLWLFHDFASLPFVSFRVQSLLGEAGRQRL